MCYCFVVSLCLVATSNLSVLIDDTGNDAAIDLHGTSTFRWEGPTVWVTDGRDDQMELQAAIDAAQKQGHGVIYLTPGTFHFSAPTPWYRHWETWVMGWLILSLILSVGLNLLALRSFTQLRNSARKVWTTDGEDDQVEIQAAIDAQKEMKRSTPRYLPAVLVPLLFLATTSAQAEPYTVWEDSGTIWTRDEGTGVEWQISRNVNAHSPVLDGTLAVWIEDWSFPADVMGIVLTRPGSGLPAWSVAVQPEIASDPRVSQLKLPDEYAYVVWRQSGGIWGRRLRDLAPPAAEIVPQYTGPFDLTGRTLTWDGGSVDLHFPTAVPEPGTLVLLLIGLACCGWHLNSRPRRPSGS